MRVFQIILAVLFVGAVIAVPAFAVSNSIVKLVSTGDFTDRDGSLHSWKVNGAHTLIWDGKPYLPVGGVFYSRYICTDQTETNWQADQKALELIKGKGITDLLLKAVGPITFTKPEAWQKLLDYLDANGFTYGIDFSDGPKAPLSGYVIEPTRYRYPDIVKDAKLSFSIPDVTSGMWLLCSAANGAVLSSGGAMVSDDKVAVNVRAQSDQTGVLLLYPKKEFANAGIGDPWTGFDEYRDRLVKFVGEIAFGKGLRFFVDPLSSKMDFHGEMETLVPDSADFRIEYEAYIAKKYMSVGSINSAWALKNNDITSFQQAARLIPLWRGSKGVPALFDRANGRRYDVDSGMSKVWNDIISFRDSSAQNYMNAAGDILKRHAANVPVVYKAGSHHRVYANSLSRGGFDGLGIEAFGHGGGLVVNSAGPAYSLAEESARSMWLIVTDTEDDRMNGDDAPGYPSSNSMLGDLDYLREIGAKGLFVRALQMLPEETGDAHSLLKAPEQIDWLASFKTRFQSANRADYTPYVVYYPVQPVVGATVTRLGPGAWWIPSLRTGARVDFSDTVGAYYLAGLDGLCMWSRSGPVTLTFPLLDRGDPKVAYSQDPNGIMVVNTKKKTAVLTLGASPVVITGLDPIQAFPVEFAEAAIKKLDGAIARAKASNSTSAPSDQSVKNAREVLKNGRSRVAFDIATTMSQELYKDIGIYAWIEGESAVSSNFDGVQSSLGASLGAYLALDTPSAPPMSNYAAAYYFPATKEATHQIWIACTAAELGTSPFSFSVDNGPWQSAVLTSGADTYADDFAWYMIGSVNLVRGTHLVQFRVDGPGGGNTYRLGIDAVVFSPTEFKPNGVKKP